MGVHTIEAFVSTSGLSESQVQDAVNDWVEKNSEWIEDHDTHQISLSHTGNGGTGVAYFRGLFRFTLDDAKDNLIQKASDKVKNKVAWFRLLYHQCDHDEADRGDCTWDERWNWEDKDVTVPEEVEALIPEPPVIIEA